MAWKDILLSELPEVTGRGAAATAPVAHVKDNGQIQFNSYMSKALNDDGVVGFLTKVDLENPKKFALICCNQETTDKVLNLPEAKRPAFYKLGKPSDTAKSQASWISASRFLRLIGYDYIAAGTHSYDAVVEEIPAGKGKLKAYVITLPAQTPTPKPVTPRKPRASKGGTDTTANTPAVAAAVAATATTATPAPVAVTIPEPTGSSDELFS